MPRAHPRRRCRHIHGTSCWVNDGSSLERIYQQATVAGLWDVFLLYEEGNYVFVVLGWSQFSEKEWVNRPVNNSNTYFSIIHSYCISSCAECNSFSASSLSASDRRLNELMILTIAAKHALSMEYNTGDWEHDDPEIRSISHIHVRLLSSASSFIVSLTLSPSPQRGISLQFITEGN